ncbi:MAG: SpoIID/LytB domain-containing protein [Planctomycetales bacterium]|nr:SpoIID/LytB domain-containing protein [Planctomycetales bacterium]
MPGCKLILLLLVGTTGLRAYCCGPETPTADGTIAFDPSEPIRPIRVVLGGMQRLRTIRVDGPYKILSGDDPGSILAEGERLDATEVAATQRKWLVAAPLPRPVERFLLKAQQDGSIWVGKRCYRGHVRFEFAGGDYLRVINEVDLEDYLASVVSCEMPGDFPPAAQQAQVIAARTYALFHMLTRNDSQPFDVYDSSRSQNYRGLQYIDAKGRRLAAETEASRKIVAATQRAVLVYQNRLFCSYYSATCGGRTADGRSVFGNAPPPLYGHESDCCVGAPNYRWTRRISIQQALQAINAGELQTQMLESLRELHINDPGEGRLAQLSFSDGQRKRTLSAAAIRGRLPLVSPAADLPSPFYNAQIDGDEIIFTGRGWGHGVGLCQWGSRSLALRGMTSAEILDYYFPGSTLVHLK